MEHAFHLIQAEGGESVYLRLTTRELDQPERTDPDWQSGAIAGAYWLRRPGKGSEAAIVAMGAVMPEALSAWEQMADDLPGLGLLNVTSPDLLHRDWSAKGQGSHIAQTLPNLPLVTLTDGAPASLSWLGGVHGQRVAPLGVDRFGQTGDLPDLFREYGLDADAVVSAMASLFG